MRQIGSLPRERDPRIFADYLLALGIKSRVDDRPEGWVVWVYDEDHLPRAREEFKAYLDSPDDPKYASAGVAAREARRREAQLEKEYRKNVRDVSAQWGPPGLRRRPLTMTLVAITIVVYILQNWSFFDLPIWPTLGDTVHNILGFSSFPDPMNPVELSDPNFWRWFDDIRHGQVWRLVTPIFLHFSPLHILFNMVWLIDLGTMIEIRRNRRVLGGLVLIIAVASNFGQFFYMGEVNHFFPAFGGMSGVVYGLLGYIWMKGQHEPEQGMALHPNTISIMLFWLVACMTGVLGPIANVAHFVGLVAGVLLGLARY